MNLPGYRLVPAHEQARASDLSPDKQNVLAHTGRAALVLGGPGTGKTTLLIEQVARRVEAGIPLDRLLILTHSRSLAQSLRGDIVRRVGGAHLAPRVTTVHGFCVNLMERFADGPDGPPRLLRAPEQEFRLRELLSGHDVGGWPPEVAAAAHTRLFATQLRTVLARARQLCFDPEDLRLLADSDPVWESVGEFFEEYLTVLDFEGALDYAELVHRSRLLLAETSIGDALRSGTDAVFCDEFAELDLSQLGLLGDLADLGVDLVAYADPQQSIFRFRGADERPVTWFRNRFGHGEIFHLTTNHRGGAALVGAWQAISSRLTGLDAPQAAEPAPLPSRVQAVVYDDVAAEMSQLCVELHSAHAHDGVPWRECAVITRTARTELAPLARALRQAGIPVEIAGDEIALAEQLAVRPLMLAMQVVLDDALNPEQAARLLTSPLCGLDSVRLRGLGRRLRSADRMHRDIPRPSAELLAAALREPEMLPDDDPVAQPVLRLGRLLQKARADLEKGVSIHSVLWGLWQGTEWPERLQQMAVVDADLRANSDLDAVCELFELASRSEHLRGERGLRVFLNEVSGQVIPADTGRESDLRGRGVRLLTAHRAKGEQFRRVFVTGAREGNWPRLTRRGSLLEPETLTPDGIVALNFGEQIANERRLFYVACSRASEVLVVSGTLGDEGDGSSRFLTELGVDVEYASGPAQYALNLEALAADLRQIATDSAAEPGLRRAAASRIAVIAGEVNPRGVPLVPAADPDRWWGVHEISGCAQRPQPLRFVGTDIADILECPRRWFLRRRVRADDGPGAAAALGTVVHLLAQHAIASGMSPAELGNHLDAVWDQIPFEAAWLSASERTAAEEALDRIYAWQNANDHSTVLGVEVPFEVAVDVEGEPVIIAGSVDRLELDDAARLRIVDFKTARNLPTAASVVSHEQLGIYQLAARAGAFDSYAPGVRATGGAQLVFVRGQDGPTPWPKVFSQPSLDDVPHIEEGDDAYPTWVHGRLAEAARRVRSGSYPATPCISCRFCPFQRGCPVSASGQEIMQ